MSVAASSVSSTAPMPIRPASHKRTPSGFSAYALNAHGLPQFSPSNLSRSITSLNGMSWSETFDFTSRSPLDSSLHFANPGTSPMSFSASLSCSPGFTAFYGFDAAHFRLEQEFCQNFTCCGLSIPNLHELVNHFESAHVLPTDELGRPIPCSPLGAIQPVGSAAPVLTPQQITKLVQHHNQQQAHLQQQQQQQQHLGGHVEDAASPQSSIEPTTPPNPHSFASGVVAAYEHQSPIAQPQPHQLHQQNSPMSPNQTNAAFGSGMVNQYQHHDASGAAYHQTHSPHLSQVPSQPGQAEQAQQAQAQAQAQAQMMQMHQTQQAQVQAQAQQQQQQHMQMQMTPQGQISYQHLTAASQPQGPFVRAASGNAPSATSPVAPGLAAPALPSVPAVPAPNSYAQQQVPQTQMVMQQQQRQQQQSGAFGGYPAVPSSPPHDAFGMTSVVRRRTSPVLLASPTSGLSAHSSLSSLYSGASGLSRANSLSSTATGMTSARGSLCSGAPDEDDVMMDFDPLDDAPYTSQVSSPVGMHPGRTTSPTEQPLVCLPPALFSAPSPSPGLAGARNGYFDEVAGRSRSRGGSTPTSRAASPHGRASGVMRTKDGKSVKASASASGSGSSGSSSSSSLATNLLSTGAAAEKQRLKAKLAVLDPLAIRERMGEAKEAKEPTGKEGKGGRRTREKGYKCPIPGCTKSYLNPNGLKYHLNKGTCTIAPGLNPLAGATASMPTTPAVSTPPSMTGTPTASAPASPILDDREHMNSSPDLTRLSQSQTMGAYQSQHSELQNALLPTY